MWAQNRLTKEHNDFFQSLDLFIIIPELEISVLETKCKLRTVVLSSNLAFKSIRLIWGKKNSHLWYKVEVLNKKKKPKVMRSLVVMVKRGELLLQEHGRVC